MPYKYKPISLENQYRLMANAATQAAHDMKTILIRNGLLHELTQETQEWIERQDKINTQHAYKKIKQQALDKLTPEERRVLGL